MSEKKSVIIGMVFGLVAGIAYGFNSVLVRYGVGELAPPLVGAAVSLLTGTIVLGIFGIRGVRTSIKENGKGVRFMLLAGLTSACDITASFFALSIAPVVVVSPLQSTNPLFALLFSWLFLGRLEKITPKLILGTVLIVSGVILITLGRTA
ncbi:EamA family transporter [Chloroflexota bacterium]